MKLFYLLFFILISCFRSPQATQPELHNYQEKLVLLDVSGNHMGELRHSEVTDVDKDNLIKRYMLGGIINSTTHVHFFSVQTEQLKKLYAGEDIMVKVDPYNGHTHTITVRYSEKPIY